MNRFMIVIALVAVLAGGCGKGNLQGSGLNSTAKPSDSSAHRDEPEHPGIPKRVRLEANVEAEARIRLEPAALEVLRPTVTLSGELAADPDKSGRVASPVGGRIEKVRFREGMAVKKGDALLEIGIPELGKVRAAHASAATRVRAARTNVVRLRALADKGLAAEQEVANTAAEAESLEAEANALAAQLAALGMSQSGSGSTLVLRAPVSGLVITRDAIVGQPVVPEQTLAVIANLDDVWFLARVFEKDLSRIRVGSAAEVVLNGYPTEPFAGVLEHIGRQVDPNARTVTARIRLVNRDDTLRLGLFGFARVQLDGSTEKPATLVVPRSAVTDIGGKPVVFVHESDGHYELHEVVLGTAEMGKVEVVSGIRAGEAVVVEGVFTLKSVVMKSTMAEEE